MTAGLEIKPDCRDTKARMTDKPWDCIGYCRRNCPDDCSDFQITLQVDGRLVEGKNTDTFDDWQFYSSDSHVWSFSDGVDGQSEFPRVLENQRRKWIKDEESLVVERFLLEWSGSPRLKIPLERMAETIDFSAIRMFQSVNVLFSLLTSIDVSFFHVVLKHLLPIACDST